MVLSAESYAAAAAALTALLGVAVYLLFLALEREKMIFYVEFYKTIRANADRERKLAEVSPDVSKRYRRMEVSARAVVLSEGLLEVVRTPPPPPAAAPATLPAPTPAPRPGA